jgi:hypothetical protein
MYSSEKLYDFVESVIDASISSDALYEADSARRLRYDITNKRKVVRVEAFAAIFYPNPDPKDEELDVPYDIEFLVLPEAQTDEALTAAKSLTWGMYKQFKTALLSDQSLSGTVCLADADAKAEIGEVLMNGAVYGVTLGGGKINRATPGSE